MLGEPALYNLRSLAPLEMSLIAGDAVIIDDGGIREAFKTKQLRRGRTRRSGTRTKVTNQFSLDGERGVGHAAETAKSVN